MNLTWNTYTLSNISKISTIISNSSSISIKCIQMTDTIRIRSRTSTKMSTSKNKCTTRITNICSIPIRGRSGRELWTTLQSWTRVANILTETTLDKEGMTWENCAMTSLSHPTFRNSLSKMTLKRIITRWLTISDSSRIFSKIKRDIWTPKANLTRVSLLLCILICKQWAMGLLLPRVISHMYSLWRIHPLW